LRSVLFTPDKVKTALRGAILQGRG